MPSSFVFINLADSEQRKQHQRAIKSHVSGDYRKNVRAVKPSYGLPRVPRRPKSKSNIKLPQVRKGHASSEAAESPESGTSVIEMDSAQIVLFSPGFGGTRSDPFMRYPAEMTPNVPHALDHYTQVFAPSQSPVYLAMGLSNPYLVWTFPLFMQNADFFHAMLGLMLVFTEKMTRSTWQPSKEVLYHRGQAVNALRASLERSHGIADDAAIMTMVGLTALDRLLSYTVSSDEHWNYLGQMVASRGGIDKLGQRGLIRSSLLQVEYFRLLETDSGVIFPRDSRKIARPYLSNPVRPTMLATISKFPQGFQEMALQAIIGLDIIHIIDRICDYMSSKIDPSKISSQVHSDADKDIPDIFDTCTVLQTSSGNGHLIERNICLAVILFAYNIYSMVRDSTTVYRGARQALTTTLPSTHYSNQIERECLIWIYMTTIESWRNGEGLATKGKELMQLMLSRFAEAASWPTLDFVLRRFFWFEPLARQWYKCWEEGMRIRPRTAPPPVDSPRIRRAELRQIWEGQTPIRLVNHSPGPP